MKRLKSRGLTSSLTGATARQEAARQQQFAEKNTDIFIAKLN